MSTYYVQGLWLDGHFPEMNKAQALTSEKPQSCGVVEDRYVYDPVLDLRWLSRSFWGEDLKLYLSKNKYVFIYLPELDLGCSTWDLPSLLQHAGSLGRRMWNLVPSNPGPLPWECRVSATGPPGKSLELYLEEWEVSHVRELMGGPGGEESV